jgi:hypothetical protein
MKKGFFLLLALSLLLVGWTTQGQKHKLTIWEYKVVQHPTEASLNELGVQGWELVSVTAYGGASFGSTTAYLKRGKPAN